MTTRILLTALVLGFAPGAVLAMCPGNHEKVVDCASGEKRDPVSGQCTKPVNS